MPGVLLSKVSVNITENIMLKIPHHQYFTFIFYADMGSESYTNMESGLVWSSMFESDRLEDQVAFLCFIFDLVSSC